MRCDKCGSDKFHVIDRRVRNGRIQRRRECKECGNRFNTVEIMMGEYNIFRSVLDQKYKLQEHAKVFSDIVQDIADSIPETYIVTKGK